MALADTLGWLADLVAQHLYRDDVPQPQRRRWSLDGDGWGVVDDEDDEVLRLTLTEAGGGAAGNVPSPTGADRGSVLQSLNGSTIGWQTELQLGSDPAVAGEVRLSTLQGIYTRDSDVDIRLIDLSSGPVRVGDAAKVLALVGTSAEFTLTDQVNVTINTEETLAVTEDIITHRLGSDNLNEAVVWGRATGVTGVANPAAYTPGIVQGVFHVVADFVVNEGTTDFASARLVGTFEATASTITQVGVTTIVHDQESHVTGIYTPTLATDGTDIFARAAAVATHTIDVGARMHVTQLTIP